MRMSPARSSVAARGERISTEVAVRVVASEADARIRVPIIIARTARACRSVCAAGGERTHEIAPTLHLLHSRERLDAVTAVAEDQAGNSRLCTLGPFRACAGCHPHVLT